MEEKIRHRDRQTYIVQHLYLAFKILYLMAEEGEKKKSEISKHFNENENQISKILETLEKRGYVQFNKRKEKYFLGIKNFEIGQAYLKKLELRKLAFPYLKYLSEKFKETVYLAVKSSFEVVYIEAYEVKRPVLVKSRLGRLLPMYASASGKVHLANMSELELEEFFKDVKLIPYTKKTIIDKDRLVKEIQSVKESGFAIDDEEFEEEVRCISVPVKNFKNDVVGAITLSAPSFRMSKEKLITEIKDEFMEKVNELSCKLGYKQ